MPKKPNKHHKKHLQKAVILTATEIQTRILQTDANIMGQYSNVVEAIRPFVAGEFPDEFLKQYTDEQIQAFRWVKIVKQGEVTLSGEIARQLGGTLGIRISRIPLSQEEYLQLVDPNTPAPPDNLDVDHLPFLILKTSDEQ